MPHAQNERMVHGTDSRNDFAAHLHLALDALGRPMRGRAAWLAEQTGLSAKGCGKWLSGEAMPDTKRLEGLAKLLRTSTAALMGDIAMPEQPDDERLLIEIATRPDQAGDLDMLRKLIAAWARIEPADVIVHRGRELAPPETALLEREEPSVPQGTTLTFFSPGKGAP